MLAVERDQNIDRASALVDRASTAYLPAYARAPDIRMDGVRFDLVRLAAPASVAVHEPDAQLFYFLRRGRLWLDAASRHDGPICLEAGTAVAMGHGRRHVWRTGARRRAEIPAEGLRPVPFGSPPEAEVAELIVGHIDRKNAALATATDEFVLIPPGTAPYSAIFQGLAAVLDAELAVPQVDGDAVERRVAEIIVIQLVRFGLDVLEPDFGRLPSGVLQDERLLRALTAFHEDPARSWTVKDLADVAGLSRGAFAERFHVEIGEPPLRYVGRLRMRRAAAALGVGRRSLLDVAQSVGYRSEAAFIRAFQRHFGISPGRWRRAARSTASER